LLKGKENVANLLVQSAPKLSANGADLNIVLSNYNQSLGVGAAVPEPGPVFVMDLPGLIAAMVVLG
jgi:hypothetical protein